MPPPTMMASTFLVSCSRIRILSETFEPPMMAMKGLSGFVRTLPRYLISLSIRSPAADCAKYLVTPAVDEWARWAVPKASLTSRSRTESLVIGRLPHLRDHHLRQLRHAAGVAPLVVVPADELEEVLVELDAAARVEDRGAAVVDEVAGDDLVLGVAQDALEVGLGGLLHRALDLVERRVLHGLESQVDDGDGGCGHAERHAGQLALDLRDDERHGLGGAGGRG